MAAECPEDRAIIRNAIAIALWEKQFEGSVWQNKIHLIAPRSLEPYREFADKLIDIVLKGYKNG